MLFSGLQGPITVHICKVGTILVRLRDAKK